VEWRRQLADTFTLLLVDEAPIVITLSCRFVGREFRLAGAVNPLLRVRVVAVTVSAGCLWGDSLARGTVKPQSAGGWDEACLRCRCGERASACRSYRSVAGGGAIDIVREQRGSSSSLCLCLLLGVRMVARGVAACCSLRGRSGASGRVIIVAATLAVLHGWPEVWTVMTSFVVSLWGDGFSSLGLSSYCLTMGGVT
jgi:hypothetical protein